MRQTAGPTWGWITTEQSFINSAIQGIEFSIIASFVILLISTQNIIISLLCMMSVAMVILSVVYIIVTIGWEFGVSESLCIVFIIGLSVDYSVHLAIEYNHSMHRHRKHKIR